MMRELEFEHIDLIGPRWEGGIELTMPNDLPCY